MDFTLKSTFPYQGWKIKYTLLQSPTPSHQPSVVFVHGTPWSSLVFIPLAKALLARGRTVLLYDLPGYGVSQEYSPPSQESATTALFDGDTSVKFQGEALAALLTHLKLDDKHSVAPPAVIAHDIAGTIALRTHLIHNIDFSSLLLLDTNAVLPWGDGFYKLVRSQPRVFLEIPPKIFEAMVRAVVQSAFHKPESRSSGWVESLTAPWIGVGSEPVEEARSKQSNFVRQIAQANDQDVAEMLDQKFYAAVRCDVKILWGEEDQWIPREKMEQFAALLGDRLKAFVTIPAAGHLIMIDQPERIEVEMLSWLDSGS